MRMKSGEESEATGQLEELCPLRLVGPWGPGLRSPGRCPCSQAQNLTWPHPVQLRGLPWNPLDTRTLHLCVQDSHLLIPRCQGSDCARAVLRETQSGSSRASPSGGWEGGWEPSSAWVSRTAAATGVQGEGRGGMANEDKDGLMSRAETEWEMLVGQLRHRGLSSPEALRVVGTHLLSLHPQLPDSSLLSSGRQWLRARVLPSLGLGSNSDSATCCVISASYPTSLSINILICEGDNSSFLNWAEE